MLKIDSLRKRFGEVQALDGVTFDVHPGEVFGFLGANGAGKTTTMRIVLGFLHADAGTRHLERPRDPGAGRVARGATCPRSAACTCGCRSSTSSCSTVRCTACRGRRRAPTRSSWLARFRIAEYADRRAESLSKGNQQKVQFIATVLHDPDVILMDEPFVGLDPVNVALLEVGLPRVARPRQDARLQHPPAGDGRGALRVRRDHRPRPASSRPDPPARSSARPASRPSGSRSSRDGDLDWLRSLPHVTVTRPGEDYTELHVDAGRRPAGRSCGRPSSHGGDVLRFEVADPSLEEVFVERVGALEHEETTLATPGVPA